MNHPRSSTYHVQGSGSISRGSAYAGLPQYSSERSGDRLDCHLNRLSSHQTAQRSDCVFKHMGRLVCTTSGVDRFAGSASGVHFVHSAEQKYLQVSNIATVLDESVYKLHLLPQPMSLYSWGQSSSNEIQHRLPALGLPESKSCYLLKVERFFRRWGSTYPILSPKQFYDGIHRIIDHANESIKEMPNADFSILHQLYLILAVNAWDNAGADSNRLTDNALYYFKLTSQTHLRSTELGDLSTLQSLLRFPANILV